MSAIWPSYNSRRETLLVALNAKRSSPPSAVNRDLALGVLQEMLRQAATTIESVDTKAALVIPAVGAIGSLVAGHVNGATSQPILVLGWVSAGFATASIVYAVGALWRLTYSAGPGVEATASLTSRPDDRFSQGVLNSLAIAVDDVQAVVNVKAARFNRALLSGAISVVLLLIFGALGGIK